MSRAGFIMLSSANYSQHDTKTWKGMPPVSTTKGEQQNGKKSSRKN